MTESYADIEMVVKDVASDKRVDAVVEHYNVSREVARYELSVHGLIETYDDSISKEDLENAYIEFGSRGNKKLGISISEFYKRMGQKGIDTRVLRNIRAGHSGSFVPNVSFRNEDEEKKFRVLSGNAPADLAAKSLGMSTDEVIEKAKTFGIHASVDIARYPGNASVHRVHKSGGRDLVMSAFGVDADTADRWILKALSTGHKGKTKRPSNKKLAEDLSICPVKEYAEFQNVSLQAVYGWARQARLDGDVIKYVKAGNSLVSIEEFTKCRDMVKAVTGPNSDLIDPIAAHFDNNVPPNFEETHRATAYILYKNFLHNHPLKTRLDVVKEKLGEDADNIISDFVGDGTIPASYYEPAVPYTLAS